MKINEEFGAKGTERERKLWLYSSHDACGIWKPFSFKNSQFWKKKYLGPFHREENIICDIVAFFLYAWVTQNLFAFFIIWTKNLKNPFLVDQNLYWIRLGRRITIVVKTIDI